MAPTLFEYSDLVDYTKNFSEELGRGGSATVFRGDIPRRNKYGLRQQSVAVKQLNRSEYIEQFEVELSWLDLFQHKGIVGYIGQCILSGRFFIVLEYMPKGDLARNIPNLRWNDTIKILRRIASTILYLHTLLRPPSIVIGDLKCANVLLTKDNKPKLCDFGSTLREGDRIKSFTPGMVDPQARRRNTAKKGDDIHCFGVMILELIMKEKALDNNVCIRDRARTKIETDQHVVHEELLKSGCSKLDAVKITELAMELTRTRDEPLPENILNIYQDMLNCMAHTQGQGQQDTFQSALDLELEYEDVFFSTVEDFKSEDGMSNQHVGGDRILEERQGQDNQAISRMDEVERPTIQEVLEVLNSLKVSRMKMFTSALFKNVSQIQ